MTRAKGNERQRLSVVAATDRIKFKHDSQQQIHAKGGVACIVQLHETIIIVRTILQQQCIVLFKGMRPDK